MDKHVEIDLASFGAMKDSVDSLDSLVAWAESVRESVPLEYRDRVRISVDTDYDTGWSFEAYYVRPMTDAEMREQERQDREREAARRRDEHQLYLRLKAKYEALKT